ncbi:PIN/TRAM domain-containing protein [Helicovermis profundi]|uniref:PIN/TRAM domain-containing protein n=1 Tax=Helicovermis profundi TaxID=3065157 RepID=A0AAU9E6P3_9FIRM|nr:PIN/TRAM domain-containing protein [Clostridia bacterium S502]
MIKRITKVTLVIFGLFFGYAISSMLFKVNAIGLALNYNSNDEVLGLIVGSVFAILFGLIFYFLSPKITNVSIEITNKVEVELGKVPVGQVVIGSVGLIIGLIIAYLISPVFRLIPIKILGTILTVAVYGFLGYLGIAISTKSISDLNKLPDVFKKNTSHKNTHGKSSGAKPKILDTSVIIDGRISDICKTNFIEGALIIPEFVLKELRHIADSSDSLKRSKGRRGLDILKTIQQEMDIEVRIVDNDFDDVHEVDIKLLKLAQEMNGVVVTNDYNLNKVASLQGVTVLNINELANAVKPVLLPGEEMVVTIIKEGKESNQGIAFLDDGTMIVVEGAKKKINVTMDVVVTSVLQTAAGRMIFAKPK